MHDKFKSIFLKLVALLCVYLLFHAPAAGARALFFNAPTQSLHAASGIAAILLGFTATLLIVRDSRSIYMKLCSYATSLIPAVFFYPLSVSLGMPRAAYETTVITILWFIGVRGHYLSYDSILNFYKIFPAIVLNFAVLCIAVYFKADYGHLSTTVFIFFYAFLILFFILQNQANIDDALEKKGVKSSVALKKIRTFNIVIVLCMFAAIPILLNLKTAVTFTVKSAISATQQFAELVSPADDTESEGTSKNEQSGKNDQDSEAASNPDENPAEAEPSTRGTDKENNEADPGDSEGSVYVSYGSENTGPKVIIILSWITAILLTAAVVIWITKSGRLKNFFLGIHYIASRYFAKLRRYFKKLLSRYNIGIIRGEDYTDEVEFTADNPEGENGRSAFMGNGRHGRIKDKNSMPALRVRHLYVLVLKALSGKKINIHSSDTTGQIFVRSSSEYPLEPELGKMTKIYDRVRYGDLIPDENNVAEAEASCSSIVRTLKGRNP